MFWNLKPGDRFQRMLSGDKPWMIMEVESVGDQLIHARAVRGPSGYTFDRATGVEEDLDLEWGVAFGVTGSYIDRKDADAATSEGNTS